MLQRMLCSANVCKGCAQRDIVQAITERTQLPQSTPLLSYGAKSQSALHAAASQVLRPVPTACDASLDACLLWQWLQHVLHLFRPQWACQIRNKGQ